MNHDLIERYVYAVTKRMNRKQREDVSLELRGLIDDMLTERCGDLMPTEKDLRVVLTELGTPQELALQYDEDKDQCLIGQPYYSVYKYILKIVLACVAGGLSIAHLLLAVLESRTVFEVAALWLNSVWNSLFASFAFVTLLFAFFQRKGIRVGDTFSFDDLPPVPKRSKQISRWESIAGIGFCVMFAVLFLLTPDVFCMYTDGLRIPIFDAQTLQKAWLPILLFAACGIFREAVQLLEGEYNRKVMVTALATDVVSAVLCTIWIRGYKLLNPAFVGVFDNLFAGESDFLPAVFRNFDLFFLGCMLFALALDAIDVTVKTLRK